MVPPITSPSGVDPSGAPLVGGRFQLFPALSEAEYAALRADIGLRGVLVPVEKDERGETLDGHHRERACVELGISDYPVVVRTGMDEQAKAEHVLTLNLARRHLGPIGWADAFRQLLELRGVRTGRGSRNDLGDRSSDSVSDVAAELGVTDRTARRRLAWAQQLAAHPDLGARVDAGELTVGQALTETKRRAAKASLLRTRRPLPATADVRLGDCRSVLADCEGQVDLVFSDPPYLKQHLPLLGEVPPLLARLLRPGGIAVTYTSHFWLPQVLGMFDGHLEYVWTVALVEQGQHRRLHGRGVWVCWKPLLVHAKPPFTPSGWFLDAWWGDKPDKRLHPWQQSVGAAGYYIDRFSQPGDLVCDPFLGSGTTGVAAIKSGRRFVGAEVDRETYQIAKRRIATESGIGEGLPTPPPRTMNRGPPARGARPARRAPRLFPYPSSRPRRPIERVPPGQKGRDPDERGSSR